MKTIFIKNFKKVAIILLITQFKFAAQSQCGTPYTLGSAFNSLTHIKNSTNPVAVDKNLNTVVYLHRHNPNVFGGNSGNLRYDISTTGGTSWSTNVGVLNPVSSSYARYPNVAIYNPTGNTNPQNAYVGYIAATINTGTSAWNGNVTGVRQLNGSGNTEFYNQPSGGGNLIPTSMVKGAPGTFWAVDVTYNGTNFSGGVNVYKGVWNGSNNVNWTTNTVFTPAFNTSYNGSPIIGEYNIAFDPAGIYGWVCVMTDLTSGPGNYGYYPVFYKTVNGGNTWSGPIDVDLFQFSCITANVTGGNTPAAHYAADLTVDVNGNPHLFTTVGFSNNTYGINYNAWHHVYDITQINGLWTAYDVANIKGSSASYAGSNSSTVSQEATPQVSRSADGNVVFFGWTDNTSYSLGSANFSPNFFGKGFNVVQNKWTQTKDFSSCNFNTAGKMLFPHLAEDVLEPSASVYKLAPVYAEFVVSGDPDQITNFKFLDNATFNATDFTINQSVLNVSIQQGTSVVLCPGNSINLQLNGSYSQILWTGGSTAANYVVSVPGIYYVAARSGCAIGGSSITVSTLSMSVSPTNTVICEGGAVTLNATGNATSYTWNPGSINGNSFNASPGASVIYTVTGSYSNCTNNTTVNVSVNPSPLVFAISSQSFSCPGAEVILVASGATNYLWNNGATSASISVSPQLTTTYSVTGTNNNGCSATFAITQAVTICEAINSIELNENTISIYPNPNSGNFVIKTEFDLSVTLINQLGQVVNQTKLNNTNNHQVQFNNLSKGIYFVVAQNNKKRFTKKIVIE